MPSYDWWLLVGGQWKYLGRFVIGDWSGLWSKIQLIPEAQLYTRQTGVLAAEFPGALGVQMPFYDWWLLGADRAWHYLGQREPNDWAGFWAMLIGNNAQSEAQLFARRTATAVA